MNRWWSRTPKCLDGHDSNALVCEKCGKSVIYRSELAGMARLPEVSVSLEKALVFCSGFPRADFPESHVLSLVVGDKEERTTERFQVKTVEGGTWYDYYSSYNRELRKWLVAMGMTYSQKRFVLVDATNPVSVLALSSLPRLDNTIVFGIMASGNSTMVNQNVSYTALNVIERARTPAILLTKEFVDEAVGFFEGKGLMTREEAMREVFAFLMSYSDSLSSLFRRDSQLGILIHCISTAISASGQVYKSVDDVYASEIAHVSIPALRADVQTSYLFAAAPKDMLEDITKGYAVHLKGYSGLLNAEHFTRVVDSKYGLFSLILVLGVKENGVASSLERGYEVIARKSSSLRTEVLP